MINKISTLPLTSLGAAAAAVVEEIEVAPLQFRAPGVYFGLPEDDYHADPSLGSTDMRLLARDPREFWWQSRFNLMRDDEDEEESAASREAKMIGRATHAAVLEGREALEARFAPAYHKGNVKAGKDERAAIIEDGKEPVKFKRWRRIVLAASIIRSDPHVGEAFSNPIATELSVFWRCPRSGIPKKARFDAVKPRSLADFKTIANRDRIPFEEMCCRHIGSYGYHTQAECYRDGWAEVHKLLDLGAVFGEPTRGALDRLKRAAQNGLTVFAFVFLQKAGAPLVWGTTLTAGNPILDEARREIEIAESNWREYVEKFGGFDQPWLTSNPLRELDVSDIPAWAFRRR